MQSYDTVRFVLTCRRLELFGEDHNLRPGWVTVGKDISTPNFDPKTYAAHFQWPGGAPFLSVPKGSKPRAGQPNLLPQLPLVERLRPKSPIKK